MKSDLIPTRNTPRPALEVIGDQLRDKRKSLGLSQYQLAKLTGTSQAKIASIESGKGNPTFKTLDSIAAAMNSEVRLFVSGGRDA